MPLHWTVGRNRAQVSDTYDGLSPYVLKEYTGTGAPARQYYLAAGQVVAARQFGLKGQVIPGREPSLQTNGGLMYYQTDARRTVTQLTDRHGDVIERYRYDAFGGLFTGITAPYSTVGLTGHHYDPKAGLVDMKARWYAPDTGRFLTPDVWPGEPITGDYRIATGFGAVDPWHPNGHQGVDLTPLKGSPTALVMAAAAGSIVKIGWENPEDHGAGCGLYVVIDHGDGVRSYYCHLEEGSLRFEEGDDLNISVKAGQVLANAGSTGHSTGVHLHFAIREDGKPVDPNEYVDLTP